MFVCTLAGSVSLNDLYNEPYLISGVKVLQIKKCFVYVNKTSEICYQNVLKIHIIIWKQLRFLL